MKVLLPLLSLVLLLSVTGSPTGANKKKNVFDQEEEYSKFLEHSLISESAEEMSDQRETREVPEDSLGEETYYDHREVTPVEASREEYLFRQHLDEEDLEENRGDGYPSSRHLNEQAARQKFKRVAENRASRNLVEASEREVNPLRKLGSTKTHICDNKFGMYRTVWLNLGETAFLYSPSFFQRKEYPNNSNCGWKFETPAPQLLSFSCSVFDIREGDYLSLRDGSSEVQRFSGGRKLNYTTEMHSAFVIFYSNENESGRGFTCTATSVMKSGTGDDRQDEVKPSRVSDFEISSVQSVVSEYAANLARKTRISTMSTHYTVSPPIGTISVVLVSETIEASTDVGSQTDRYDSSMTKSKSENVGQEESSASEGRLNYMKLETMSSSMIAGVHSSKVLQTVIDARGYPSVATRTLLNSTRVVGSTTDVVEKREDGGGAEFAGIYTYDPSHSPGHTTTSVQESNMSSETNEKAEFVRDDRTGEKHQLSTSSTKKSKTESTEIQSSKIDFSDDFVELTPPM